MRNRIYFILKSVRILLFFLLIIISEKEAQAQVMLYKNSPLFTNEAITEADVNLRSINGNIPYVIYYIPQEWWVLQDNIVIAKNRPLHQVLMEDASDEMKTKFTALQNDFSSKVETYFRTLPTFNKSVIIIDNVGKTMETINEASTVKYLANRKFIFGDDVPAEVQNKLKTNISPAISLEGGFLNSNDTYLQNYISFIKRTLVPTDKLSSPTPFLILIVPETITGTVGYLYMDDNLKENAFAKVEEKLKEMYNLTKVNRQPDAIDFRITDVSSLATYVRILAVSMEEGKSPLMNTVEKATWKINEEVIPVVPVPTEKGTLSASLGLLSDFSAKLKNGANTINVDATYNEEIKFIDPDTKEVKEVKNNLINRTYTAKFNYDDGSTAKLYVKVKRVDYNSTADIRNNMELGDEVTQTRLKVKEKLQVQLFEDIPDKAPQLIENAIWKVDNENEVKGTSFEFAVKAESAMLDVKKTAVSSAMRILLKVAEVKPVEPMGKMNNTVRMLNTTALQNNADIVNANVMYDTALAQIKRTKPDLFNFCTSDQVDLQVAVVAAKQEGKVMKNGLSTIMKSYRIDASLLDLSDIVTDNKLETGTIVNAKVTLKLNPVEREAIMIASAQKEETNMAQEIISRINVFKPKAAKDLVSKIKKGEVTKEILDGLRYYVDSTRPDLYLKVEQKITVSFNYTNISASQEDFTKTVAHEFGHCRYPFQHLFWALKWGLIVERKSSFKYKLSNELGLNGIGMCSEGTGHEMYNPENKEVCDCEKGLPK